ncbi:MAG: hypothetical protein ACR2HS_04060 [Gammaproteobacteria bacterium]
MAKKNVTKPAKVLKKTKQAIKKVSGTNKISTKDLLKTLDKPMTQTQQIACLSETTSLTKKDVSSVIEGLFTMIGAHLKKIRVNEFSRVDESLSSKESCN